MSHSKPFYGECQEGSGKTLRARIVGHADTPITQASINASGVKLGVWKYTSIDEAEEDRNAAVVQAETALTTSAVIFDALQAWDVDSTGYNFAYAMPAALFPDGNVWYRVEVWIDPEIGEDFLGALFFLEGKATTR